MVHHPCIFMGPQQRGPKSEVATSPLPSRGPKRGQKCYITPAFSWVPNKGDQNQKWLPHPCLLGGPKEVKNATSPLHSHGSPTKGTKIRSGCLTLAFSGAQKRSKMLHHPCIPMGPQQRGPKSEVAASPLPSRGPKRGQKCYITPAFSWVPNKGDQNQKWLPHPYLLGGPKEVKNGLGMAWRRKHANDCSRSTQQLLQPSVAAAPGGSECLVSDVAPPSGGGPATLFFLAAHSKTTA